MARSKKNLLVRENLLELAFIPINGHYPLFLVADPTRHSDSVIRFEVKGRFAACFLKDGLTLMKLALGLGEKSTRIAVGVEMQTLDDGKIVSLHVRGMRTLIHREDLEAALELIEQNR